MTAQEFNILVGLRIRSIRESKELSQQDLAAKCNFEKSNMSRIEAGRTNLTLKTLFIISNALSISAKELLDI
ncbi:MAG TPA: helix-turn-helix transcriptional regulator [Bacteroidales bacterium]|nr:helix-turn-helix transcriptional regulator [Bacteroidales bacterium]